MFNRLICYSEGDTTAYYTYNAEDYRVSKNVISTEGSEKTLYFYEGSHVLMEADENGEITARNTYGTYLLSRTTKTEGYYYLYNAHGDVVMLLDAEEGGIAATYVYDAFGTILLQTGTVDNSITYAGYQYDYETGLYYVNARYYDSTTARFLTEDTYQGRQNDPLSLNRYTYCHNNPIRYYDPSGHFALFAAFLVGAVIGGVSEYVSQKVFQKKEKVDWKAVAYESLAGGIFTTISAVTGGLGTTAAVASTAAKSAGKTVGKSAVKTAIKSVAKSAVKKSVKTAAKATVKTAAKTTAKSIAKTAIKTGVSEATQGFATDVGRQVIVDGKSLNEVDYGQAVQSASIAGAFGIAGSMTSSVGKTAKASVKTSVAKYTDNVTATVSNIAAKADNAVQAAVKKTKVSTVSVNGTGSKSGYLNSGTTAKTFQLTDTVSTNKVGNGVAEGVAEASDEYVKLYHATNVDAASSIRTNGVNLNHATRNLDFGRGFYTTTDRAQAQKWINMRYNGNGDIIEFNVPKNELNALNGKQFNSGDSEWLDFVTKSRKGMANDYDYVSGPMLMNSTPYLKYGKEAVAKGQQTAFNTKPGVELLNRYMHK